MARCWPPGRSVRRIRIAARWRNSPGRLPPTGAIRLERLRGFGAALGTLVTCGCARLDFADGSHGILVAAAEPVGRAMPLTERLQRLVEGIDTPIAAFARDGMFVGASDAARSLLGFRNLSEAGLDDARSDALKQGRVETPIGIGHMVLQRVGTGADVGLVALIVPGATPAAPGTELPASDDELACESGEVPAEFALVDHVAESSPAQTTAPVEPVHEPVAPPADLPMPDYEQPALSGEAPAEFALIDEVATEPAETAAEEPPEPDLQSVLQLDMPHVEASARRAGGASRRRPSSRFTRSEPSPYVEAVADEPTPPRRGRTAAGRSGRSQPRPPNRRRGSTSPCPRHAGTRCASCGRWMPTAASRSAPTNSPG